MFSVAPVSLECCGSSNLINVLLSMMYFAMANDVVSAISLALSLSNLFFQPGTMASVPNLSLLSLALSRYCSYKIGNSKCSKLSLFSLTSNDNGC